MAQNKEYLYIVHTDADILDSKDFEDLTDEEIEKEYENNPDYIERFDSLAGVADAWNEEEIFMPFLSYARVISPAPRSEEDIKERLYIVNQNAECFEDKGYDKATNEEILNTDRSDMDVHDSLIDLALAWNGEELFSPLFTYARVIKS